jgi:hypothetical protein
MGHSPGSPQSHVYNELLDMYSLYSLYSTHHKTLGRQPTGPVG